jgi:hypothetical protein
MVFCFLIITYRMSAPSRTPAAAGKPKKHSLAERRRKLGLASGRVAKKEDVCTVVHFEKDGKCARQLFGADRNQRKVVAITFRQLIQDGQRNLRALPRAGVLHHQPVCSEVRQPPPSRQKRHIMPRPGQPITIGTADYSGTDDDDPHESPDLVPEGLGR